MGIQYNYTKSERANTTNCFLYSIPQDGMEHLMAHAAVETIHPLMSIARNSTLDRIRLVPENIQGHKAFHAYRLAHSEMPEQYLGVVAFNEDKEAVILLATPAEEAERLAG